MLDTFNIGALRIRCYIDIPMIIKYIYVAFDALLHKQYSLGSDICHLLGKRMFQNKFSDSYFLLQHGSKKRNRLLLYQKDWASVLHRMTHCLSSSALL